MYNCPSRRIPPARWYDDTFTKRSYMLMDYAGVTPGRIRDATNPAGIIDLNQANIDEGDFWGWHRQNICNDLGGGTKDVCIWRVRARLEFHGIIVRTDWDDDKAPEPGPVGNTDPTKPSKVTDGLSKTLAVGEKRLHTDLYHGGDWHDSEGWMSGWDGDTMRASYYPVGPDVPTTEDVFANSADDIRDYGFCLGSAHVSGFFGLYGDGSVRMIGFDIDRTTLNRLGQRDDGEMIDSDTL
jgi:hypothetical protein